MANSIYFETSNLNGTVVIQQKKKNEEKKRKITLRSIREPQWLLYIFASSKSR